MTPSPAETRTGTPQSDITTLPVPLSDLEASISGNIPTDKITGSQKRPESRPISPSFEAQLSHSIGAYPAPSARSSSTSRPRSLDRSSSPTSRPRLSSDVNNSECRQIIVRSFAPRIAVYASPDTEDFVRQKGFKTGLCGLLRPFGERIKGKVVVRDSVGASRSLDDFGVRIYDPSIPAFGDPASSKGIGEAGLANGFGPAPNSQRNANPLHTIEDILNKSLETHGLALHDSIQGSVYTDQRQLDNNGRPSHLFTGYLRRLLSSTLLVPYETFVHPVACLIAVSSHNSAPIEALRQLYAQTGRGNHNIPPWVGVEYLRYYVLIHDDENDDITKSTALFDLMKRHFGLHCHLLRLTSSQCVLSDDDSTPVPICQWLSAEEELAEKERQDSTADVDETQQYVVESDATAINALLREMVTQSVVPFMESRVMTWNDQVASRRRGLSGRFISLSKRWTGFGSSKGPSPSLNGSGNSSGNYDAHHGFYPPQAPEAIMRQLADYAIMLRDWKLAYSTYDFVRSDFGHDKAWAYHAAANEMAAVSFLLLPFSQSKTRSDAIDQMLETAVYSYLTRNSSPFEATRCLILGMELLQSCGSVAADHAARWAGRLLELGIIGPASQTLTSERIAEYYMSRVDFAILHQSPRRRQAALWNILAAHSWDRLGRSLQARSRFQVASLLYGLPRPGTAQLPFHSMQLFWESPRTGLDDKGSSGSNSLFDAGFADGTNQESSLLIEKGQLCAFVGHTSKTRTDHQGFISSTLEAKNVAETDKDGLTPQGDGFE
ncbi:MAG: hypothetical protein Q9217_005918 [Psora testacea]